MDIKEATTTYGREFIHDLIDIALITDFQIHPNTWRELALRHGLCKRTTKTVRSSSYRSQNYWYYKVINTETGERKYSKWEEPQTQYAFVLKNGSGKDLLRLFFTKEQMEEWLNETNPNHTEPTSSVQQ